MIVSRGRSHDCGPESRLKGVDNVRVVQSLPESLLTASQRQLSSEVDESHWYDYNSSCAYSECLLLSQRDTVVENRTYIC